MANSYFRFKEFTVEQDRCAMKVSTDACILGAWCPVYKDVGRVLDIGTGTGLLSLMIAQRARNLSIDAIELDNAAAIQAKENVSASPWGEQINIIQGDVVNYRQNEKYDLIICNPPFFNDSLLGPKPERNNVRHTLSLNYEQLVSIMLANVSCDGYAVVLLPADNCDYWRDILHVNGWYISKRLDVYPKVGKKVNRVVLVCKAGNGIAETEKLNIRDEDGEYTADYRGLMSPYYLDR